MDVASRYGIDDAVGHHGSPLETAGNDPFPVAIRQVNRVQIGVPDHKPEPIGNGNRSIHGPSRPVPAKVDTPDRRPRQRVMSPEVSFHPGVEDPLAIGRRPFVVLLKTTIEKALASCRLIKAVQAAVCTPVNPNASIGDRWRIVMLPLGACR